MKRNNPTRVVETGRLMRGSSGQPAGWLQDLGERARVLEQKVAGILARLSTPLRDGVPGCVPAERVFEADTNTIVTIPNFPIDPYNDGFPFLTLTVNPILRAGETYSVPVFFPPPGVFLAHYLVVGVEAGFTMFNGLNRPGISPVPDYISSMTLVPNVGVIRYTNQQQVLGTFTSAANHRKPTPYVPFLWNIVDNKSGRKLSNTWLPSGLLLNSRLPLSHIAVDSDLFEFDGAGWLFERDGQTQFLFRPLVRSLSDRQGRRDVALRHRRPHRRPASRARHRSCGVPRQQVLHVAGRLEGRREGVSKR